MNKMNFIKVNNLCSLKYRLTLHIEQHGVFNRNIYSMTWTYIYDIYGGSLTSQ